MSSAKQTHDALRNAEAGQLRFTWSGSTPTDENPPSEQPHIQATDPIAAEAAPDPAPSAQPRDLSDSPRSSDCSYGPGHPWHYYREGDNAPPVPFDDIPASEESGRAMERELPKSGARRIVAVRDRLESERRELDQARIRYQEIIDRGAEALSRYDREIAYGGNDYMARAGTLALLFNQAAWRKGRIACLERERWPGANRR